MEDVSDEEVSDYDLMEQHFDARAAEMNFAFPAKVEAFNTDGNYPTVDCVPQLNRHVSDGQGGYIDEELPKLVGVPVKYPRCGKFFMSFPLEKGDYVLVVCCQRSIAAWRSTAQQGDPGDIGMHTLDGAVALPGLYPDGSPQATDIGSTMKLGRDGNPAAQIELTDTEVKLGGGSQYIALANKVATEFARVKTTLDTLTGATFSTTYPGASSVAAANVKGT